MGKVRTIGKFFFKETWVRVFIQKDGKLKFVSMQFDKDSKRKGTMG